MLVQNVVEHASVEVVGVHPGELARSNTRQLGEHAPAPVDGELCDVQAVSALLLCEFGDFGLDGASPVEHGAADIECQGLDLR